MPANLRASIDAFLAIKRLAMIGVSRRDSDFSRHLFRKFVECGYDVIPVNPQAGEIEGRRAFAHIGEIPDAPEAALVITSPDIAEQVVRECADAGVRHVWLHRGAVKGAVSIEALRVCRDRGMHAIAGECPFMFLAPPSFPHNLHAWLKKLTNQYPG